MSSLRRLSMGTLREARADVVATYDRSPSPRIVHLGVGAFARAHLGVYADDLLRGGWPATISGVSLRSATAEEEMAPQDGLYTVEEQDPGAPGSLRVVGSFTRVATGATGAVLAIASPDVHLVTLTVTEKGYELDPGSIEHPAASGLAPAVVAQALARRRSSSAPPPVVASLDNVSGNGSVLRSAVLACAERLDPSLPEWISQQVAFPDSVVDRMVPASTGEVIDRVAARLGLLDVAAVTCEHHRSWVIEAAPGLPPLADVGVQVVTDTAPFERRKLWLLNCSHSAVAYAGLLVGCKTIAEAARQPAVHSFVRRLVDEIVEVSDLPVELEAARFGREVLERFENPGLGHTCLQVAADGSRKLQQRLQPVVVARRRRGLPTDRFAMVVAAWMAAVSGIRAGGRPVLAVTDPEADTLRRAAACQGRLGLVELALAGRYDRTFVLEVASRLSALEQRGAAVLEEP